MFLSTLQPSAAEATGFAHGVSIEKTAVETEIGYLPDLEAHDISVDVTGDFIVLEGVVKSSRDHDRVVRVAQEIVGYERVLSRLIICSR